MKIIKSSQMVALLVILMGLVFGVSTYASSTATAVAQIQNGAVVKIDLIDKGSGYPDFPKISLVGGGGTGAIAKVGGLDNSAGGCLLGVDVSEGGQGYCEIE